MNSFACDTDLSTISPFVGRRQEIYHVLQRLLNLESTSIVGEHCLGKSTLLSYLMDSESLSQLGLHPAGWLFIRVDLKQFQTEGSATCFWNQILEQIANEVAAGKNLSGTVSGRSSASSWYDTPIRLLQDAIDELSTQQRQPVLVLDDFDLLANNSSFGIDFLNGLRSLAIRHNPLPIITTSRKPLIDLFDYSVVNNSPFFNIFGTVLMGLLRRAEAEQLLDQLLQNTSVHFSQAEHQQIMALADSHPYLLRLASENLLNLYGDHAGAEDRLRMWERRFQQAAHPLLADYWERSSAEEKGLLIVLAVLAQTLEGGKQLHAAEKAFNSPKGVLRKLANRGLVTKIGALYQPASGVFSDWIMEEARRNRGYPEIVNAWREADQATADALGSTLLTFINRSLQQPA